MRTIITGAYAAGAFDENGYCNLQRARGGFALVVHTQATAIKDMLQEDLVHFLEAIRPYAVKKRALIDLALSYIAEFGRGNPGYNGRTSEQKKRQEWYYQQFKGVRANDPKQEW